MDADGGYERFISGVSGLRGCIFMHQAKIVDVITKMMAGIPKEGPEDFFDAWPLRRLRINGQASKKSSGPDRKSTRLNSSHQIISYAVFCLKKKKINVISLDNT